MNNFYAAYGSDYDFYVDFVASLMTYGLLCILIAGLTRGRMRNFFLLAMSLRFILAIVLHCFAPYGLFAEDPWGYALIGKRLAEYWQDNGPFPDALIGRTEGLIFYQLNAFVFLKIAYAPLLMSTLSCAMGTCTVWLTFQIATKITSEAAADLATRIVAFFPSLVLWSAMDLRDMYVINANLLVMLALLRWRENKWITAILMACVGLYGIKSFRYYILPFFLLGIVSGAGLLLSKSRIYFKFVMILMPFIVVGTLYYMTTHGDSLNQLLRDLSERRKGMADGNGAYYKDLQFNSIIDVMVFLPVGLAYFLMAPFPWSVSSFRQAFTVPETILWYYMITKIWRGTRSLWVRSPNTLGALLSLVFVLVIPYALASGNVGTGYRHRAQTLPYLFIIAAEGMVASTKRRFPTPLPYEFTERQFAKPVNTSL